MHPAYQQQVPGAQPLPSLFVTNETVLEHNLDSPPSSDLVTLFEKPAYFRHNLFMDAQLMQCREKLQERIKMVARQLPVEIRRLYERLHHIG